MESGTVALRDNGVKTQFIGYPVSGQCPTDPVHQRDVLRRHVEWLRPYLSPGGVDATSAQ